MIRSMTLAACALVFVTGVVGCERDAATQTNAPPPPTPVDPLDLAVDADDDLADFRGPKRPFADAEVFLEFNATDDDLGFQLFLDGDAWRRTVLLGPEFGRLLDFRARGELEALGLTELRFESAEPSPSEVLALFDEGPYVFLGKGVDGDVLHAVGELSHALPPTAHFTPGDGDVVPPEDLVVEWEAIPGLAGYEVIVENEDTGRSLEVELDADATRLEVPDAFLEEGTEYKVEVLTVGLDGNKTIVEASFTTSD